MKKKLKISDQKKRDKEFNDSRLSVYQLGS